MTREEAILIKREIQRICEQKGVWFDVNHVHKPELKDIVITVTIRVSDK